MQFSLFSDIMRKTVLQKVFLCKSKCSGKLTASPKAIGYDYRVDMYLAVISKTLGQSKYNATIKSQQKQYCNLPKCMFS